MNKMLKSAITFLVICIFAVYAFAEISINPSKDGVKIAYGKEKVILNNETPAATIADTTGSNVDVKYDTETGGVTINATSGSSTLTYGIANIYLDAGESARLSATGEFRTISIAATKGEILIIFPSGSKIVMSEGSAIQLVMRAGGNYYLSVTTGGVEYTNFQGNRKRLTTGNAPLLVQGF